MAMSHPMDPTARPRATWRWVLAAFALVAFQVVSVLLVER